MSERRELSAEDALYRFVALIAPDVPVGTFAERVAWRCAADQVQFSLEPFREQHKHPEA